MMTWLLQQAVVTHVAMLTGLPLADNYEAKGLRVHTECRIARQLTPPFLDFLGQLKGLALTFGVIIWFGLLFSLAFVVLTRHLNTVVKGLLIVTLVVVLISTGFSLIPGGIGCF